jgi:hypothetical protein
VPCAAHKAPHFVQLAVLHLADDDIKLGRIKAFQETFVGLCDRRLFFSRVANLTRERFNKLPFAFLRVQKGMYFSRF